MESKLKVDFLKETEVIKRKGIDKLLEYLETTDFFTAPASTAFHGAHERGLVLHSLSVYDVAKEMNTNLDLGFCGFSSNESALRLLSNSTTPYLSGSFTG